MVLKEKGLDYTEKIIEFSKKEHKSDEILALNPRGQVPTTKIDDLVINESTAACDYLEMIYGDQGTRLWPQDKTQLAEVLQRQHEASNLRPLTGAMWKYSMNNKDDNKYQEELAKRKETLMDEVARWEKYMEKKGPGSHIASKDFSMADVLVFPAVAFLVRLGLELGPRFPNLAGYYEMVKERPSVKATLPPHWSQSDRLTVLKD